MNSNNIRKNFGFALTLVVGAVAGWLIAWNQASIETFINSIGGIGNILVALVGLAALFLAIFWPKKWSTGGHRVLIAVIILVLIFGGTKVFGTAFAQAPWLTVLLAIGLIIAILVLHSITIVDRPIVVWRARFPKKKP
jgi:hypothetical protein